MPRCKTRIDYSKPAKEILWECLLRATSYILRNKKISLDPDTFHELLMEIALHAHARVMNELDEWNTNYEFFNFVYFRVWGCSGYLVERFLRKRIFQRENVSSIEGLVQTSDGHALIPADTLDASVKLRYLSDTEQVKARRRKYLKNPRAADAATAHDEYDDYCEYCAEFEIAPMTESEYLARTVAGN